MSSFWTAAIDGVSGPTLLGVERHGKAASGHARVERKLGKDTLRRVRSSTTARSSLLAAAWALLLARYNDQDEVVFALDRGGRRLPLRLPVPKDELAGAFLKRVAGRLRALLAEADDAPELPWSGGSVVALDPHSFEPGDEALRVMLDEDTLIVEHEAALFEDGAIARALDHLERILLGLFASAKVPVGTSPLLGEAERRFLLEEVLSPPTDYPREALCHRLFEAHARRAPDAPAVKAGATRLSYAELNREANRIARVLRRSGVGEGMLVGVCVRPSARWVAAFLGVVKSGAAYVGIDPQYPAERQAYMIEDSGVKLVLTERALAEGLKGALALDDEALGWSKESGEDLDDARTSDALLYRMYTSGSTGNPKCVGVSHRNITRMLAPAAWVEFAPGDRVAQAASTSFDVSVWESWGALLNGAELVIVPKEVLLTPHQLERFIVHERLSTLFLTTGLFNHVALILPHAFKTLKSIVFGGDVADPAAVRAIQRAGAPKHIVNAYGPTEHGVFSSSYDVPPLADDAATIPIGKPLPNDRLYILDSRRQLVPVGVKGEIMVGGDGLSPVGYNDAAMNAERWIDDPIRPGERLYRTGDQGRFTAAGVIEFLGRNDHQVKIRGFRVELQEIEVALGKHPAVRMARVLAREDQPGVRQLVAYVVLQAQTSPAELLAFVAKTLPSYMVPAAVVVMDALPLTANGKVDRRALPKPVFGAEAVVATPARSPSEARLAEVLEKILAVERVDVNANFFALGMSSIQVMQFLADANKTGSRVTAAQVFAHPTIAELAKLSGAPAAPAASPEAVARPAPPPPPPAPISREVEVVLPCSAPQLPHLLRSLLNGGVGAFSEQTLHEIVGSIDVPTLKRALADTIAANPVLRTELRFDPRPVQLIRRGAELPWEEHDLTKLAPAAQQSAVAAIVERLSKDGHPLSVAPLARAILCRTGPERATFIWSVHAPICDGWSQQLLLRELFARYERLRTGEAYAPPRARSFKEYASWARGQVLPPQAEAFWRRSLRDAPWSLAQLSRTAKVQLARPRDVVHFEERRWSPEADAQMRAWLKLERVSMGALLHAVFALSLAKHFGHDDVLFATMASGRMCPFPGIETVVGMVGGPLPFRAQIRRDAPIGLFVREVQETLNGVLAHEWVPLEQLMKLSKSPLAFDCVLAVQSHESMPLSAEGASLSVEVSSRSNNYAVPLALEINPASRWWRFYATKPVISGDTEARALTALFERLLSTVSALGPTAPLGRLLDGGPIETQASSRPAAVPS